MIETLEQCLLQQALDKQARKKAKKAFKSWLRYVETGPDMGRDEFRKMLIILVDKPL